MIEIVKYMPCHLKEMGYDPDVFMLNDTNMRAFTALVDGKSVASGGIRTSSGGICEAWFIHSDDFKQKYISVCKEIKKVFNMMLMSHDVKIVTASYDLDNEVDKRFMEWLGFTKPLGLYYHLDGPFKGKTFMVVMRP
jgi:hypothetical protein